MNHCKFPHPDKGERGSVSLFSTRFVVTFTTVSSIEAPIMTILTS